MRLTYDDDLFLRAGRVLGIPVVNQSVWRLHGRVDHAELDELARAMAGGRLGRLVVRSRVPGARDRWVRAAAVPAVVRTPEPIAPSAVLGWAHEQADVDLDPELGPGWRFATAETTDGGSVLSLTVSHAIGDGGAHIASVVEGRRRDPSARVDVPQARVRDDVRDAAGQVARAARGVWRAVRDRHTPRAAPPLPPGTQMSAVRDGGAGDPSGPAFRAPLAVVDCDAAAWDRVAAEAGGTANALLVAVATEVLLSSGRVRTTAPVRVALPVSGRRGTDLRANATVGVSIVVDPDPSGRVPDLRAVRERSKAAFSRIGVAEPPARAFEPLVQLLPDPLVARLARTSPVPLCLCSNLGALPEEFVAPLGAPAAAVAMRSMTRDVTRSMLRARGGGLSVWLARVGGTVTLSVLGLDPDHFPDEAELGRHVAKVLEQREIPAKAW